MLQLYDALTTIREDPVVRLNRAVALAEVEGAAVALAEIDAVFLPPIPAFASYHAVRTDLLRRLGRTEEARAAYRSALDLVPGSAERRWLLRRMNA